MDRPLPAPLVLAALVAAPAAAQLTGADTLVLDINEGTYASSPDVTKDAYPSAFLAFGERLFFSARSDAAGTEPWITDGTAAGTVSLGDLVPGPESSQARGPVLFGGHVYFLAYAGPAPTPVGLWRTDGTAAGTTLVVAPGTEPSALQSDIFLVERPEGLRMMWVTKGTGNGIWSSDGTAAGTQFLGSAPYQTDGTFAAFDGALWFSASGGGGFELWRAAPGSAPALFFDCNPAGSSQPRDFTVAGTRLYFTAVDDGGRELWSTDGTQGGTARVTDLFPGSYGSEPRDLVAAGDLLVFAALAPNLGYEPHVSDGTAVGTVLLADTEPGSAGGYAGNLVAVDGEVLFAVSVALEPLRFWRGDPVAVTAAPVVEAPIQYAAPKWLTPIGDTGTLLFQGDELLLGQEVWAFDAVAGTVDLVADVREGSEGSTPGGFTRVGDKAFFAADDGLHGSELHVLDVTASGVGAAQSFGQGCGAAGPILAAAPAPTVAGSTQLSLAGGPAASPSIVFLSAAPAFVEAGAGCTVYLAAPQPFASVGTDAAGAFQLTVPVPADPTLVGVGLWWQSFSAAIGGNFLGLGELSGGLETLIGS